MIYPWLQHEWQRWVESAEANRIPHALLLTGLAGLGKTHFAAMMVRSFFCKQYVLSGETMPNADCICHACQLITGETHPNVLRIHAEETKIIKIDAIRAACNFMAQTAVQGKYRIIIIESAHKMNHYAANALLKTLEEPAPDGIIILVTDQEGHLPATIRSRCNRRIFTKPNHSIAHAWLSNQLTSTDVSFLLHLAHGAPLKALALAKDDQLQARKNLYDNLILLSQHKTNPVDATNQLGHIELAILIEHFIIWIKDLMHLKLQTGNQQIISQDFLPSLSQISPAMSLTSLLKILNFARHYRLQIEQGINLNKQLLMETLFYHFEASLSCS